MIPAINSVQQTNNCHSIRSVQRQNFTARCTNKTVCDATKQVTNNSRFQHAPSLCALAGGLVIGALPVYNLITTGTPIPLGIIIASAPALVAGVVLFFRGH